ncbi:MAG: hypothetical protein IJV67_04680, partial [Clostridia bacterium]|nr:hypothetical protein [Clostridia bacterium]
VSEMAADIKVENLTVNGSITGRTKVGIVGYFDMVCNNYINGGNIKFKNVTNNASVTGYTGVGGLLGTVSCTNDAIKAFVEGCENNGDITLLENGKYAGGIVGCAGFYQKSGVDIKDSANNGNVTAKAGASYVGGIAGYISDNLSSVQNVENTGDVTAVNGVYGDYIGYTGALRTDITAEGAIGKYVATGANDIKSVSFKNTEMASTYGNAYQIFLSKSITPNYKINLTFKNNATGELFQFTRRLDDGTTETYTEREMNDLGYYSVILDPAEYTVSAIVRNNDEYFNSGVIGEDGLVLAATATYTVSKKALNYTFANVTTPYTGEAVDYFTALESASGYDKESHKIPDTSAETGAKWVVTYTLNGNAVTSTAAPGTYQVSIRLDATDKFASRYEYSAETYNVEMVVKALITVTVDSIEITQGENATFTVTVKTYDGSEFTNLEALGLTFSVKGFGSQTSVLPAGTHTVTVTGAATVDGADVEYVSGTLTVKAKTQNPTSSSSAAQGGMGCGLDMGASLMGGIALVAAAFAAIRSRKH